MQSSASLSDDATVIQRVLDHIDGRTTDLAESGWREPVEHYRCPQRFERERALIRRLAVGFCASAALPEPGAFVAREAAGTPLVAVRGLDGRVRAFLNACSHRGAQVADTGAGCARALVCPYHGWSFGLDGRLRGVPHDHGFPELDRAMSGLTELEATERGGVVFVRQLPSATPLERELAAVPADLIPERFRFVKVTQVDVETNWKIAVEGFLEGYHIRSTHPDTFFPIQFDNLNVIEEFGRNTRVVFPYRNIEGLRDVPRERRSADGRLTYAYHLFPNVIVATQPGRMSVIVLEPIRIDATRFVTCVLSDHHDGTEQAEETFRAEESFAAKGALQDRVILESIQRSLGANTRSAFEFGLFEGAIAHFHRELTAALAAGA